MCTKRWRWFGLGSCERLTIRQRHPIAEHNTKTHTNKKHIIHGRRTTTIPPRHRKRSQTTNLPPLLPQPLLPPPIHRRRSLPKPIPPPLPQIPRHPHRPRQVGLPPMHTPQPPRLPLLRSLWSGAAASTHTPEPAFWVRAAPCCFAEAASGGESEGGGGDAV